MDTLHWVEHFRHNQKNRPEPDWLAPITLSPEIIRPLVRSIEQFQLGDGGGPAYLIASDRERLLADEEGMRLLVDLWFAEEREHSRLLLGIVSRFGGHPIRNHWSFRAFCLTRQVFGVGFELTTLLVTEIASTAYYQLLKRHAEDPALCSVCRLILRDEAGHIAFHRARLTSAAHTKPTRYGRGWEVRFRCYGLVAATMLWINHAPGLRVVGATQVEFYREVQEELRRFVHHLRRGLACSSGHLV